MGLAAYVLLSVDWISKSDMNIFAVLIHFRKYTLLFIIASGTSVVDFVSQSFLQMDPPYLLIPDQIINVLCIYYQVWRRVMY